jgi:outer membrane beta-barrel protein
MENWTKCILLKRLAALAILLISYDVAADEQKPLIEPDVRPVVLNESMIDSENFELGLYLSVMNIEDFEYATVKGLRFAYHLSESLMFEAHVGADEAGHSSIETLGGIEILSDDDREYQYYNVGIAYKLPGESYFGSSYAFNNNLYLSAAMGATEFAGESRLTGMFGVGYQLLMTDYLSLHFSAKEHLYEIDVIGPEKLSLNSEIGMGLSFFF